LKILLLIKKEFRLQRIVLWATLSIYALGLTALIFLLSYNDRPYSLDPPLLQYQIFFLLFQMLHEVTHIELIFVLPLFMGVFALSAERRAGMVEAQSCLPFSWSQQWWLKIGFVLILSALLNGLFLEFYDGQVISCLHERRVDFVKLVINADNITRFETKALPPVLWIFFFTCVGLFCSSLSLDAYRAFTTSLFFLGLLYIVQMVFDPFKLIFPFSTGYPRFYVHPVIHFVRVIVIALAMLVLSRLNFRALEAPGTVRRIGQVVLLVLITTGLTELCLRVEYAFPIDQGPGLTTGLTRVFGNDSLYLDVDYSLLDQNKLVLKVLTEDDRLRANPFPANKHDRWHWNCAVMNLDDYSIKPVFPRMWLRETDERNSFFYYNYDYFNNPWESVSGPGQLIDREVKRLHPNLESYFVFRARHARSVYFVVVFLGSSPHGHPGEEKRAYLVLNVKMDQKYGTVTSIDQDTFNPATDGEAIFVLSQNAEWLARIPPYSDACVPLREAHRELKLTRVDLDDELVLSASPINIGMGEGAIQCFDRLNICAYTTIMRYSYELALSPHNTFLALQRNHPDRSNTFAVVNLKTHEEKPLLSIGPAQGHGFNGTAWNWFLWVKSFYGVPTHLYSPYEPNQFYFSPMIWSPEDMLAILFDRTVYLFKIFEDGRFEQLAEIDVGEAYPFNSCSGPKSRLLFVDPRTVLLVNFQSIWKIDLRAYLDD